MAAYYNEIDPFAAQWLRELIKAGMIAPGDVDERSIEDVRPDELMGYTQCHFFAGIGVWSYALRQAGFPDSSPVWTGSCPCQPFSAAGKGNGFDDERHLWPHFHWLIQQCQPAIVFGEQVASAAAGPWIDLVQADLEAMGYAFGCVAFPAASVGAPHIRDRAYWVANSAQSGRGEQCEIVSGSGKRSSPEKLEQRPGNSSVRAVADASGSRLEKRIGIDGVQREAGFPFEGQTAELCGGMGNADSIGLQEGSETTSRMGHRNSANATSWDDCEWLYCRDGKFRPVEPGTFPLANGSPARVGRLRGYGNAIVAQQAEAFIRAFCEG